MKQKARKLVSLLLCFVLAVSCSVSAFAAGDILAIDLSVEYHQTEARSIFAMVNAFRTGDDAWYWNETNTSRVYVDAGELSYDYDLEAIAMQRAAETALRFSHTRPNGESCFTAFTETGDGSWYYVGENIAAYYNSSVGCDPAYAFDLWEEAEEKYDGQGHRRNMLSNQFNRVGIACVSCDGIYFWAQAFGYSNSTPAAATSALNAQKTVRVEVDSANVTNVKLSASVSTLSLREGQSLSVPNLFADLSVVEAWPAGSVCRVEVEPSWTSSNSSVVSVSGETLRAQAAGTATLTANALGSSISIPVTVTSGGSGTQQPAGGAAFRSDTNSDFTVNGRYQFRITSLDGHKPVMTSGNANFTVSLAGQTGNDYFYVVTAAGAPGSSADIYVDGRRLLKVTAAGSAQPGGVVSDTTAPFTVRRGSSYQFRLTAQSRPAFAAGSPSFRVEYVGSQGNDYFYKVYAIGNPGDGCGFYINGAPAPVAIGTVG